MSQAMGLKAKLGLNVFIADQDSPYTASSPDRKRTPASKKP
jgi:hypothetical protein